MHLSRQVGIIKLVGIPDPHTRGKLNVFAPERMTLACTKVRKRHSVTATDTCVHFMDFAGESMRRKPLYHRVWIEECPIDTFGRRAKYAVKADGIARIGHCQFLL
jgi:hypothetical protein